jgi:integrase
MRVPAHSRVFHSDEQLRIPRQGFKVTHDYRGRLRMRSRHQDGRVEERGKIRKRWYGFYYVYERNAAGKEVRRHVGIGLGDKAKLRKWEAEAKLKKFIVAAAAIQEQLRRLVAERTLNAEGQAALQEKVQSLIDAEDDPEVGAARAIAFLATWVQPAGDNLTLEWFTRERFLPMREAQWAPSTRETNLYNIEHHILPGLGAVPLARLDKFRCQTFLNDLARPRKGAAHGFSFTVIDHNRTMLKAILEEAVDAELIGKNPARKLVNPETREPEKFVLPKDQARALLEALPFRDRLMAMIAAFCAMRPGEIFGLRWSSWRSDHLQIEGTAWRGVLRPGKAKTKGSKGSIALPDVLIPALKMWREQCGNPPDERLIFPTEKQTPMRPENWLRRRIKPLAMKLGISVPVNFQVLRRTFATNAQGYGNPKDVQAHLRHTDIATTLDVYTQTVPESVRKLVNKVARDVMTAKPRAIEPAAITRRIQ